MRDLNLSPPLVMRAPLPQQQRGEVVKLFVGQIPKTLEEDGVREGASSTRLARSRQAHASC